MKHSVSNITQFFLGGLTLLLIIATPACSTFNRDWKAAAERSFPAHDIQGRWQGTWLSEVSGHTGRLRCLVTQQTPANYRGRFHAKYRKIFGFGYTVELNAVEIGGTNRFQGAANLGWYAGGRFHYEGHATPTHFFSTYRSKADHGTFQLTRPDPEE